MIFPYFPIKPSFTQGIFAMFGTRTVESAEVKGTVRATQTYGVFFDIGMARCGITGGDLAWITGGAMFFFFMNPWKIYMEIHTTGNPGAMQILSIFGIPHWRFL